MKVMELRWRYVRSSRDTQILAPRDKDASENWCNRIEMSITSIVRFGSIVLKKFFFADD